MNLNRCLRTVPFPKETSPVPRPRKIDDATILTAARPLFLEKGPGATTKEVAAHAGVSEGLLFQRYKTKADLFFWNG